MDVRCDKCQARYRIDDAKVGAAGLTMRCGKCGNTFKVTREGAASAPGAAKPAPSAPPPADVPGSTMMFQAPKIPPKAAPSAPPAAAPPPADMPGSTMMFQAPKIPPKPAPATAPKPAPAAAAGGDDDAGSTMMFGTAPVKVATDEPITAPSAPKPQPSSAGKPAPKPAPAPADGAGSTMMFGSAPVIAKPAPTAAPKPAPAPAPAPAAKPAPPPPRPPPPAPAPAPAPKKEAPPPVAAEPGDEETARGDEEPAADSAAPHGGEPVQARPGEAVGDDEIDPNAFTSEAAHPPADEGDHPPPRKQPMSKKTLFTIAGAGGAVVLLLIGLLVFLRLRPHPPPAAAIEALNAARALLDKDSLATFQQALDGAASAMALAPRSPFPEAHALQAEIELAWSDALADDAQLLSDKSGRLDDDKKKAEADAASQKAAADSPLHFKTAFNEAKAANPISPNSPDIHLALADCYRAAKNKTPYRREIDKATALKADDGQIAAIEGARLLTEDDGAAQALAKLKTALAANPQSARIQYRIAQAQAALKNDAEEKKALEATVKLSPNHERAKLMLEALQAAAAANPPAADGDGK